MATYLSTIQNLNNLHDIIFKIEMYNVTFAFDLYDVKCTASL